MNGPSAGDLAIGAGGAVVLLAVLADLFVTVFNYDGFSPGLVLARIAAALGYDAPFEERDVTAMARA